MNSNQPIGIFDSGIGGLTVADAVRRILPGEDIVYFGDTAHLPYGDKSSAAIQAYSVKICDVLLQRRCKVILIACNSASSAAYELVKAYVASRAHVINVIDPVVAYAGKHYAGKKVGIIGTRQTIASGVYEQKIAALNLGIGVQSLATPLLAPMIEEGFFNDTISARVIEEYLSHEALSGIEALVLGCTHYPLIKKQIAGYYQGKVDVIDSSETTAVYLQNLLEQEGLCHDNPQPAYSFYVSDYTRSFEESTRLFFTERVSLEKFPLWE